MPSLPPIRPEDKAVAEIQQAYWYNFIAHGDPNGAGLTTWPRVVPGKVETFVASAENRVVPALHAKRIRYWQDRWARETKSAIKP